MLCGGGGGAGVWSVLRILVVIDDPLALWVGGGAGAWNVFSSCFVIDDLLVAFGGRRRWRVERAQNSVRNQRPSRGFGRLEALVCGASSEFCSESMTLSWFWAGGGAGAGARRASSEAGGGRVERPQNLLFVIDDPLLVFGA